GHREVRPALPAKGGLEWQTIAPDRMGGDGHGETDLERKQSEERLESGLWFSILALPPQRFSRRRRVRAVLPGHAGPGRGGGDHQRCQRYAGCAERNLGPAAAGVSISSPGNRYRRRPATQG